MQTRLVARGLKHIHETSEDGLTVGGEWNDLGLRRRAIQDLLPRQRQQQQQQQLRRGGGGGGKGGGGGGGGGGGVVHLTHTRIRLLSGCFQRMYTWRMYTWRMYTWRMYTWRIYMWRFLRDSDLHVADVHAADVHVAVREMKPTSQGGLNK